jgi:PPM family protein phosphatase
VIAVTNIQSFGDKHPGRRRKNNEDFIAWFEPIEPAEVESSGCLYILADGVGGAAKGERASQYAAQKVLHGYYQHPNVEPGERLRTLISQASEEIFTHADQSMRIGRMATTMVAVVVRAGKLIVAHVGDSRVYLIREGMATQLTRDHSIVGEMIANGDMTEAEAQASKIKNKLTRSIGGEAEVHVDVHSPIPLQPGDKILLCSDGLTRYAAREDITQLTAEGSPREIVERVIKFANQQGGADNVSAILISYGATEVVEPLAHTGRPLGPPDLEDTMDTIPVLQAPKRQPVIPMLWAAVFLGIVGIVAVGVAFASNSFGAGQQATPTASLPVVLTPTLDPLIFTTSEPLPTATWTVTDTPTASPTPTGTDTPTGTLTPPTGTSTGTSATSATSTVTQAVTPTLQPVGSCYYMIKSGDTLLKIMNTFQLGGYDRITCAPESIGCTLTNPNSIDEGWIIIISNISTEDCIEGGGSITPTPPPVR